MDLSQLIAFFRAMTIINVALLVFSGLIIMVAKKQILPLHGKLFGLKEEQVASNLYTVMGNYKIVVIVFNVVPYIALRMLGQ